MQGARLQDVAVGVATGVALQVALAVPFLAVAPGSYFSRAFEFSRCAFVVHVCIHFALRCSHASEQHSTRTHPALHCTCCLKRCTASWVQGGDCSGRPRTPV